MSTVATTVTKQELLENIRAIAPILQADAAEAAANAELTDRAKQAVIGSGLLGMCVPTQYGGSGFTGLEWLEVLEEITRVDAHTGWCVMALSSHGGLFSAGLSDDGVNELFGHGMSAVAGMPAPRGKSRKVEGGYIHNGKHGFASGSSMCTHFVAGGILHDDDGKPIIADNGVPKMVMVIVPREQVNEQGNWDVTGMEATSSIDFELGPDLFVPDHMTLPLNPWKNDFPRGATYWRIGVDALGPAGHTPCALGMAHRALQEIAAIAPTRKRMDIAFPTLADQPRFQHDLALLDAELKSARIGFHDVMARADAEVAATGGPAAPETAHAIKQQVRVVHDVAVRCASFAYHNAGSTGFRSGHVLGRLLTDLNTINTHVVVDPQILNAAAPRVLEELRSGLLPG